MTPPTLTGYPRAPGSAASSSALEPGAASAFDPQRLVMLSAPALEDLYRQLDSPTATVLLADNRGGVLRAIGGGPGAGRFTPPAQITMAPAEVSAEVAAAAGGRPARPLPVARIGIAVPILPPAGGLLGFVDAETSPLDLLSHANALLQTAARIIEHRLIETEPRGFLLLRFHRYPTVLGTPLEALALFDADGVVRLANRVALELLAHCPLGCGVTAASCFATEWCGIVGYAALGLRQPFLVRDHRGTDYSARASLRRAAA